MSSLHYQLPLVALLLLCIRPAVRAAASPADLENDILRFSYELERWLDTETRPCDDFYAYVCGRAQNSSQRAEQQRQKQLKFDKFLAATDADADDQLLDAELKLKQFYASCKTTRSVEDLKATLLYRTVGGWPTMDDSVAMVRKRRNQTWLSVSAAFQDIGVAYFFRHHVTIKSNKRVVLLEPDESKRYTLRKFEQRATEVMQEYAVEEGRARLVALETLSLERARREVIKQQVEDGDVEVTYADFKRELFGSTLTLDWDAYFRKVLGKPLKQSDMMQVRQLPKLKQLFELLERTTLTRLLNWIWIDYLMDKSSSDCRSLTETYFEPVYQHIVQRSDLDRVQMAQLYASLGRAYDDLLPPTPWIDEMTQQNSHQLLGRIIHLTLNGDAKLDADYATLSVTKRNFYRNLEKCQRFVQQQRNFAAASKAAGSTANAAQISRAANDYQQLFLGINALLREQNLTAPLSYALVGERFAAHMIAGGRTEAGAWRSMDSEREFAAFEQCIRRQGDVVGTAYNANDLVLKLLAQAQSLRSFGQWLEQQNVAQLQRMDRLLAAGRLQLSMRKLYFVGSVLVDCQQQQQQQQPQQRKQTAELVNSYLRNSAEFTSAFGCRSGDALQARNICKLL